jgi:ABC-type multidrug transport system ATPase subunit
MFDSIKKKLFPLSPNIIIFFSCILSIAERFIKIYATNKSISILTQVEQDYNINIILFWALIMGIKYIFGFFRYVTAYLGSYSIQEKLLDLWYSQQISNTELNRNDIENNEQLVLLQKVCDNTKELYARISLDLLPGIISILFASYICYKLINYPHSIYCILFIIIVDIVHSYLCYAHEVSDEENYEKTTIQTSKSYVIMGETIKYKRLVHNYNRYEYEKERFYKMCSHTRNIFHNFTWYFNYHASYRLWVANLINGGAIYITLNHIKSPVLIMSVLFQVNEMRFGINEIKNFRFRYNRLGVLRKMIIINKKKEPLKDKVENKENENIDLADVYFTVNTRHILDNITLKLSPENTYILLGSNGSGKTTLFNILSHKLEPTESNIFNIPSKDKILQCDQNTVLFESESVPYNIAYGTQEIYKSSITESNNFNRFSNSIKKAARFLEIEHLENACISNLSGGERQKMSIARVLARAMEKKEDIDLLLLDEFDSALDYKGRELAHKAIKHIKEITKCCTIFITHIMFPKNTIDLNDNNNKALILHNGRIIKRGNLDVLWKEYHEMFLLDDDKKKN